MTFADTVRSARETQNYSQEALAIAAGVSRRTIQNVEAGRPASAETARSIMAVLGISQGPPASVAAASWYRPYAWTIMIPIAVWAFLPFMDLIKWLHAPAEDLLTPYAIAHGVETLSSTQRILCLVVQMATYMPYAAMTLLLGLMMFLLIDRDANAPEYPAAMEAAFLAGFAFMAAMLFSTGPVMASMDAIMVPGTPWMERWTTAGFNIATVAALTIVAAAATFANHWSWSRDALSATSSAAGGA